jgi:transcription initiation factor TFIID subunit TAF12
MNVLTGVRIGAATGAMVGGVRQRLNNQAATQQQQAGQQQFSQQMATFNRAVAACMSDRGYAVHRSLRECYP